MTGEAGTGGRLLRRDAAARWARDERARGKTVVFTNGCFDVLHPGHVHLLRAAASFGDRLLVGLNSDASVRRIKGNSRPLVAEQWRAEVLSAVRFVDHVVLFDEETPLELILELRPDILVKGGDYSVETIVGAAEVSGWGGRVEVVATLPGFSTSSLIQRLSKAQPS
jgi:rfaE bifunctional protein nucleotidyltransferase chain/domain